MSKAFVLLTAMPPTNGHVRLVEFAQKVTSDQVVVIVTTQPDEPMPTERFKAVSDHFEDDDQVIVRNFHKEMPQDPETPGFQDLWNNILRDFGAGRGDYVVSSESYGQWLAAGIGGIFIPYDPDRDLTNVKAEWVRDDPISRFADIIPEFQNILRTDITLFGAESCGKTTLSRELSKSARLEGARYPGGHWFFEWARPYLEMVGEGDVTRDQMLDIWQGQKALQDHGKSFYDLPFCFWDTDLFSTIGYWALPHWTERFGPVPEGLVADALGRKSDLYIICPSNIPFEEDPIRYGGNVRESGDKYWVDLCKQYELNYVVLKSHQRDARFYEAANLSMVELRKRTDLLKHDRKGF